MADHISLCMFAFSLAESRNREVCLVDGVVVGKQ
jgi:hypothetical protein